MNRTEDETGNSPFQSRHESKDYSALLGIFVKMNIVLIHERQLRRSFPCNNKALTGVEAKNRNVRCHGGQARPCGNWGWERGS